MKYNLDKRPYLMCGFSILELLVVMAVLGILASLIHPAVVAARRRAQMTVSIENMKQIGVAFRLYTDDWGRRPWRLHQLAHDHLAPAGLLSPGDPFESKGGWAGYHDHRVHGEEPPWPLPVSYGYFRFCSESDRYWNMVRRSRNRPGYVVDVLFGDVDDDDRYTGRLLRLTFDGGVFVTHVTQQPRTTDYWKLCTGEEDPRR